MSDKRRPVLTYDPACRDCRRDAGKDAAGATWQCGPHVAVERDRLLEQLAELKRSGKTERRLTNDYIKALHKAERQRDELRALLTAVAQSGVAWTTRDYVVAQIDKATWGAVQKIGGTR